MDINPIFDVNELNATSFFRISSKEYDFSEAEFPPDKMWIILPTWEISVKIITFLPVIIFGSIGNILLLNIIIKNRALKTPTNLLIANMAFADTATLLICPVMFLYHDIYQNYRAGSVGCKVEGFLEGVLLITAVLNLCAVSYDRLTAIVLPMESRLTIKGAKIVMICTWFASIILAMPLSIYRVYVERQFKNFLESYCKENTTILPKYWHVLIAALVWFPLFVMIISYSAIFQKLDHYEKQILKREHPLCVSYKKRVAKTLFTVVIVFVLLRVPFTVLVFFRYEMQLQNSSTEVSDGFQILWYTSHYLIFLNAAINPFIYGMNNDNFRRAYNQTPIIPCCCKKQAVIKKKKKTPMNARSPCKNDNKTKKKNIKNSPVIPNISGKCEQNVAMFGLGSKSTKITQLNFATRSNENEFNGDSNSPKITQEMVLFERKNNDAADNANEINNINKFKINNNNNINIQCNEFI